MFLLLNLMILGSCYSHSLIEASFMQKKYWASDPQESAWFGMTVALSSDGQQAVVGAPLKDSEDLTNAGGIYGFHNWPGSIANNFTELPSPSFTDFEANAELGRSVALSPDGSHALLGVYSKDEGGHDGAGAAYLLSRSGVSWSLKQKLVLNGTDVHEYANFGSAVSLANSTAVIGAIGIKNSHGVANSGAAYVYTRRTLNGEDQWIQQAKLLADDADNATQSWQGAYFGRGVALSSDGSTALIGAYRYQGENGAVYVFRRTGDEWQQEAKLLMPRPYAGANFGVSISVSSNGSTALIGAPYEDNAGVVYIFVRNNGQWTHHPRLTPSDRQSKAYFGTRVSLSNDGSRALVGAFGQNKDGLVSAGAAYLFQRFGDYQWMQLNKFVASDAEERGWFGSSVALAGADGRVAMIGAPQSSGPSATVPKTGAVYVFSPAVPTPAPTPVITQPPTAPRTVPPSLPPSLPLTSAVDVTKAPSFDPFPWDLLEQYQNTEMMLESGTTGLGSVARCAAIFVAVLVFVL